MMRIEIPSFDWRQVGGDVNAGTYGATIARADGSTIELRKIQPVREYVGDSEAVEVGFPFWTRDGWFDESNLRLDNDDVQSAIALYGWDEDDTLENLQPTERAIAIAEALLDYGVGDEGPAGWSDDVVPGDVLWWGTNEPQGSEYLSDEDDEFRELLGEDE